MMTLAEIQAAADAVPPEQRQELFLFLAAQLRAGSKLPAPRELNREQLEAWIADDEEGMRRCKAGK